MEKQLEWAHKLGGIEPLWIFKVGHTVLARLMESQIWHQSASSVWGRLTKGTMALLTLMPGTSISLYIPLCPLSCHPVLELRGSESE